MRRNKNYLILLFWLSFFAFQPSVVFANNLSVQNVSLQDRSPSDKTVVVEFDISWDNSWRTKINHDAAWITVRLYDPSVSPTNKKLCQITQEGLNPLGTSVGTSSDIEIYVPQDKAGAFIRPNSYAKFSEISSADVRLTVDYDSCGFSSAEDAAAAVMGIEMVLIPEGAFYAGDHATSTACFVEGSLDTDPWYISSESPLYVTDVSSDGYRYVSAGNTDEVSTGATFTIPEDFPKGYGAFYAMKYEISEEQWTNFVNSLPTSAARVHRDITDASHKNTDSVMARNTISCSGTPLTCSSERPVRAVNYLTWMDLSAFLDWAALRPMTELEFEKMARGSFLATPGEYSWGSVNIASAEEISSGDEDGTESVVTSGANAHYNSMTLTGGDTAYGSEYTQGPLRGGIFATSSSDRGAAGGGYYGVLDLSGNLSERIVTVGTAAGLDYEGSHGDGVLSTVEGYEGNANQPDWPGINDEATYGVTGAAGSGFRGGSWAETSDRLRTSDRNDAANGNAGAFSAAGGRGVRSYDED